jgi:U3-containing 90S pre-ribosomal complex subunit
VQKKRLKIEKLKEAKKQRRAEAGAADDAALPETAVLAPKSSAEMASILTSSWPLNLLGSSQLAKLLTEQHFLSAPAVGVPQSGATKCSFVNHIACGLPGYRNRLQAVNSMENGAPIVLIICASAQRAADVINAVSKSLKCKVAKLFAKHFKVEDQVDLLSKQAFPVAVGTPNRLSKLSELGALSLQKTSLLLIDMCLDEKGFSVLTLPIVKDDFYSFLESHVRPEIGHMKLSLVDGEGSVELKPVKVDADGNRKKSKAVFNKPKYSKKRKGF